MRIILLAFLFTLMMACSPTTSSVQLPPKIRPLLGQTPIVKCMNWCKSNCHIKWMYGDTYMCKCFSKDLNRITKTKMMK